MIASVRSALKPWRLIWPWLVAAALFLGMEAIGASVDAAGSRAPLAVAVRISMDLIIFAIAFAAVAWIAHQRQSTIVGADLAQSDPAESEAAESVQPNRAEPASGPRSDWEINEARYRGLTEGQADLICCYRPSGEIVYANVAYCRLMGRSQSELIGTSFMPPIAETPVLSQRSGVRRFDPPSGDPMVEQAVILPDGQILWVQWSYRTQKDEKGRVLEYQVAGRDVTRRRDLELALRAARGQLEQRVRDRTRDLVETNAQLRQEIVERKRAAQALEESEFLFRQITENIEEVFWVITPSQPGEMHLSPAFEKIWGRSISGARAQSDFWETIHSEDCELFEHAVYRQCLGIKTDTEYRIIRPDGSIRWIWDRAFPIRGADGRIERIIGLAQDITLQRQYDEHARMHLEELAHVSRLTTMGEMASGLAHELNQPLAAIHNYCSGCIRRLQSKPGIEPELLKALEGAKAEAHRAGEIIRRLRSFVKKRPSERIQIAPRDLILDVIQLAEPEILARQTHVILDASSRLPWVEVDAIQIEQVLLNLIRNALDAMNSTDPEDRMLQISVCAPFPDAIEFSVSDSGTGLTNMVLEQLFRPFFTTKPEGMGLGLAISRSIIEAHGGTLWGVTSPTGGGARFNFRLSPVNDEPALPRPSQSDPGFGSESDPDADTELAIGSDLSSDLDPAEPGSDSTPSNDGSILPDSPEQHEVRSDDNPNCVRD